MKNSLIPPLAFIHFTHHKCASTWTRKVLHELCDHLGLEFKIQSGDLDLSQIQFLSDSGSGKRNLFFYKQFNPYFRGFHVIRDPRDIVISAYFHHRHNIMDIDPDNWLFEYRKKLEACSIEDGLMLEINNMEQRGLRVIEHWNYNDPYIFETRFEELTQNPYSEWKKILHFLQLNVPDDDLKKILSENSFKKLTKGRDKGQADIRNHYRKGIVGDWANYFNDTHKQYFKTLFGHVLIDLGYEQGWDW